MTGAVGEEWLRIGGLTLGLSAGASGLCLEVTPQSRPFLVDRTASDLQLTVSAGSLEPRNGRGLVFESGGSWRLHEDGDGLLFQFVATNLGAVPFKEVRVDRALTRGELRLHAPYFDLTRPVDAAQYPVDELLFIHLLSKGAGVEVHACGVRAPSGAGLLFTGQSQDGKTTTARLWQAAQPEAAILSDDRIILRVEEGRVFMYGTPWHGEAELSLNQRQPLSAILVLERGPETKVIPMTAGEAVASLMARSFFPFYDADTVGTVLESFERIVSLVPCYRLPFVPDRSAPAAVLELLGLGS